MYRTTLAMNLTEMTPLLHVHVQCSTNSSKLKSCMNVYRPKRGAHRFFLYPEALCPLPPFLYNTDSLYIIVASNSPGQEWTSYAWKFGMHRKSMHANHTMTTVQRFNAIVHCSVTQLSRIARSSTKWHICLKLRIVSEKSTGVWKT